MIDGISSQPFSARTLPPIDKPIVSFKKEILQNSRDIFAQPRAAVEAQVRSWHEPSLPAKKQATIVSAPAPASAPALASLSASAGTSTGNSIGGAVAVTRSPATNRQSIASAEKVTAPISMPKVAQKVSLARAPISTPTTKPQVNLKPSAIADAIAKGEIVPVSPNAKPIKKDDAKGPKPENLNALRSALSSVLKNTPEKRLTPAISQPTKVNPPKPNEVPEEVLRKILDTDQ